MTANVDGMVREALRAFKAGKKAEARALLEKAVELDTHNEQAWMWLSAVVDTEEEQQICLQNVLIINPANDRARKGLMSMGVDPDSLIDEEPASDDSYVESSTADSSKGYDIESSVEWDRGTEPKPPTPEPEPPKSQASQGEYDNWIAGLNLDTPDEGQTTDPSQPAFVSASNFTDLVGDTEYEDAIAEKFGADTGSVRDLFGFDDEEDYDNRFTHTESFAQGPFGSVPEEDLREPEPPPARPEPTPAAKAPAEPLMSPMNDSSMDDMAFLDDMSDDPLPSDAGLFMDDSPAPSSSSSSDPAELFALIPSSIAPTRLPGSVEKYSPLLLVGLVALIFMNLGALGLILVNLAG